MKKLSKEDIYINLQGKSEDELTDLYNFLISIDELIFNKNFKEYSNRPFKLFLFFDSEEWISCRTETFLENKQEVTIQQLKEILQPMENKEFDLKGYSVEVDNEEQAKQLQELAFKQKFYWYDDKKIKHLDKKFFSFNAFNQNTIHYGDKHFEDEYVTKEIHFNDIFKETLEQQLEKAKAEVKRLEDEIEEQNAPKIGDWLRNYKTIYKYNGTESYDYVLSSVKITDQELINKLNNLIK